MPLQLKLVDNPAGGVANGHPATGPSGLNSPSAQKAQGAGAASGIGGSSVAQIPANKPAPATGLRAAIDRFLGRLMSYVLNALLKAAALKLQVPSNDPQVQTGSVPVTPQNETVSAPVAPQNQTVTGTGDDVGGGNDTPVDNAASDDNRGQLGVRQPINPASAGEVTDVESTLRDLDAMLETLDNSDGEAAEEADPVASSVPDDALGSPEVAPGGNPASPAGGVGPAAAPDANQRSKQDLLQDIAKLSRHTGGNDVLSNFFRLSTAQQEKFEIGELEKILTKLKENKEEDQKSFSMLLSRFEKDADFDGTAVAPARDEGNETAGAVRSEDGGEQTMPSVSDTQEDWDARLKSLAATLKSLDDPQPQ